MFWRQTARWLAEASPDPVAIGVPDSPQPGDAVAIDVDARDAAFAPVADAAVAATVELPGGERQPLTFRRVAAPAGRFTSTFRPDRAGLYHVRVEAGGRHRRSERPIGGSTSAAPTASSSSRASTRGSCGARRANPAAATSVRPTPRG